MDPVGHNKSRAHLDLRIVATASRNWAHYIANVNALDTYFWAKYQKYMQIMQDFCGSQSSLR